MADPTLKAKDLKTLESKFAKGRQGLIKFGWILQGSVVQILPPPNSPRAKARYIWTRKVNQKTVTVSLSEAQYNAFAKGIDENRKLEAALSQMRQTSQEALLGSLPGVAKRASKK